MNRSDVELHVARFHLSHAKHRAEFYEDVAAALDDGVPLADYLKKRADRAKTLKDPLGILYRRWLAGMNERTFAASLKGDIPANEFMALAAAELGTDLPHHLRFLATTILGAAQMKKALYGSFVVPTIVLAMVCLLLYGFTFKFVPLMSGVFPPEQWPASGKYLYALAQFVRQFGAATVAAFVVALLAFLWSLNGYVGPYRRRLDEWPVYSMIRAYQGAMTLVTLAILLGAGNSLNEALTTTTNNSGRWVRWHLRRVLAHPSLVGEAPGRAFDTGLLPRKILNRVVDRAERTNFGEALKHIGLGVMTDVRKDVENKAKHLNLALLLLAGGLMAGLVFGFLDTMYSIQDALKKF